MNNNILIAPYSKTLLNRTDNPKNYPYWPELIDLLKNEGYITTQIIYDKEAPLNTNDFVLNPSVETLTSLIKNCNFFVCVDTYLQHMAKHYNKYGVVLWALSDPNVFGYSNNINILKSREYLRTNQFNTWHNVPNNIHAWLDANSVMNIIKENI
jgi:ADP-heptose:LPS heptosyltransferase